MMASSPGGTVHTFLWDTGNDLGQVQETNVVVRILPWDDPDTALGLGTPDQTLPFTVDNDPATERANNLQQVLIIARLRLDGLVAESGG